MHIWNENFFKSSYLIDLIVVLISIYILYEHKLITNFFTVFVFVSIYYIFKCLICKVISKLF